MKIMYGADVVPHPEKTSIFLSQVMQKRFLAMRSRWSSLQTDLL